MMFKQPVEGSHLVDGVAEEGSQQPWEQQQHHKQDPQGSLPARGATRHVSLYEEVLDGGKITGRWELRTPGVFPGPHARTKNLNGTL